MEIACVCFDIGGVLIKIRHRWQDLVGQIQGLSPRTQAPSPKLADFVPILDLESGRCSPAQYLEQLSSVFQVNVEQALELHMSILSNSFEGIAEVIDMLKKQGIYTACLSNTDEIHWKRLSDPKLYPAIALLDKHVTSFQCKVLKPKKEIYEKFEHISGFRKAQILYFDDVEANILGAREQGWRAKRIDPNKETAPQILETLEAVRLLPPKR